MALITKSPQLAPDPALGSKPTATTAKKCEGCNVQAKTAQTLTSIHFTSLSQISLNAKTGCSICVLFLQGIDACLGEMDPRTACIVQYGIGLTGSDAVDITVCLRPQEIISFFRSPDQILPNSSLINALPIGYQVPKTTASEESLQWAQNLLKACDDTHDQCPKFGVPVPLPTRVLDVSSDTVKLLLTHGKAGRYLCLSHCWGLGAQSLPQTRSCNIAQNQEGIPWGSLSNKFRDAITFTRNLGISFLWIDSLCIVQDDEDDWRSEGAKMGSIYSNAYLVIGAVTRSTNKDPSMFSSPGPRFESRELTLAAADASEFAGRDIPIIPWGIYARLSLSHVSLNKGRFGWQHTTTKIPEKLDLTRRGWVFQERYLCPRIVFFSPEELSWECSKARACQCIGVSGRSLPNDDTQRHMLLNNDELEWHFNTKRYYSAKELVEVARTAGKAQVARRWLRCVEEYTQLLLTYDQDIFPALSGLASVFQKVLRSEYIAGVWKDFVHLGLIYHVRSWHNEPHQWRAPSWSWAAARSPVSCIMRDMSGDLVHAAEVIETGCTLVGQDSAGQITEGHLVLRGLLIPTTLQYKTYKGDASLNYESIIGVDFMADKWGKVYGDYDSTVEGSRHIHPGADVACFLVCQNEDTRVCFLLLLKRVSEVKHRPISTYERFGLVELNGVQKDEARPYEDLIVPVATETAIRII